MKEPSKISIKKKETDLSNKYNITKNENPILNNNSEVFRHKNLQKIKINDLQDQIHIKTDRYEKLKKERAKFKEDRQNEIKAIQEEIQNLKDKTNNALNDLIKKQNEELNKKKEANDKNLENLRREHERAIEDFNQKKRN